MTGVLPGIDMKRSTKDLSQWFTPPALAEKVAHWCGEFLNPQGCTVLEPSCGNGALIDALLTWCPGHEPSRTLAPSIVAFDIDPACCERVASRFPNVAVTCEDFLHAERGPEFRFDLTLMNPPYEDGGDGLFVERAMACSDAIVAIIRTVSLNGDDRYKRIWSRVERGEWVLRGIRFLVARPKFIPGEHVGGRDKDGAKADFVVVKLHRAPLFPRAGETCDVGWW